MKLQETLDRNNITWEQLVDIGILSGTDFNEGLMGVGPKTALKEIIKYGDIWEVLNVRSESIEYVDRIREIFLQPAVTDKYELDNLAGKPEYESICYKLITKILSIRILLTQKTHVKEETRLQRVKI